MYTGWVPNVSGFLSFSHIGGMPVRNRTFGEDVFPPTKFLEDAPRLSLLQERNLSDRPAIGWLNKNSRRGRLTFLMLAELQDSARDIRKLSGVILFAPSGLDAPLRRLHAGVKDSSVDSLAESTTDALKQLSVGQAAAFCAVRFELESDGVVQLQSIANAGPNDEGGPLCAFEAYSFLKDVLHKHRFHSGADDAMLELTQCGPGDQLWVERVLRNLHRSVISSFRNTNPSAQVEGLGKLAYLESFIRVLERRDIKPRPEYSVTSLRSALEAHQTRGLQERDEKSLLWSYMLSMAAIVVPVIFVTLQLLQMPCIEGLSNSDLCKQSFTISPVMMALAASVLRNLDWLLLATILVAAGVVLTINRKRLFAYNSDKLSLASWTNDLRDMIFRFAISSRLFALLILALSAGGLLWGYSKLAWLLLEGTPK
jgi:hypothetical protein